MSFLGSGPFAVACVAPFMVCPVGHSARLYPSPTVQRPTAKGDRGVELWYTLV